LCLQQAGPAQAGPCDILFAEDTVHLVITDSGLGGLSICAAIARARTDAGAETRITYINAWPEQGRGYNDLPDMPARVEAFERVLRRIVALSPDEVLIACNTLSVVYAFTDFRKTAPVPVRGIIDAGVELFFEALSPSAESAILLLGTRTTIESGVHRLRLMARGMPGDRISSLSCHGLAASIERGPGSADTAALIEDCTTRASRQMIPGEPSYVGLCCTHYALVADRIRDALAWKTGHPVLPLDPNTRMVRNFISGAGAMTTRGEVSVEVVSKVVLEQSSRSAMAALLDPVSPRTAAALRHYSHVPDLF